MPPVPRANAFTGPDLARPERQTALLLAAGTVLLPLQIWPVMPLEGMRLCDLLFALAFAQFVVLRFAIPATGVAAAIAAFAAGAAMSAAFGGSPVKLLGHFMLAAIGWMAACDSPESARLLRRALVVAAAIAAATAAAGAAGYYAGIPSPLLSHYGDLMADAYPRVRGTVINANMTASVVATGVILLWFEPGLVPAARLRRLIYAIAAVALVFSFSRTIGALAIAVSGVALWRGEGRRWLRLAWLAAAGAYAAALWISIRYHVVLNPVQPWAVEVLASDGSRFAIWRNAVATLAEHPLLGVGPGIGVAEGRHAHNTWLNLWAGLGIVPLAAFAFLMAASVLAAIRSHWPGVACALAVALIDSLYTDIEDMRHIWLLIGIALSPRQPGSADAGRAKT